VRSSIFITDDRIDRTSAGGSRGSPARKSLAAHPQPCVQRDPRVLALNPLYALRSSQFDQSPFGVVCQRCQTWSSLPQTKISIRPSAALPAAGSSRRELSLGRACRYP
jgi:hypothetical protein